MLPYLICAIFSSTCTFLATHLKKSKGVTLYICIFSALSIFAPCFLAAVRDSSIGTDVLVYGNVYYYSAQNKSFISFMEIYNAEPLFKILIYWVLARWNIYIYYFLLQLCVILPIYLVLMRQENRKYAWFGILLYIFLIYPASLNLMRQCIALSVVFWGSKYIFNKQFIRFCIVIVVSMGMHYSGIIGLPLYFIYYLTTYERKEDSTYYNATEVIKILIKLLIISLILIAMYNTSELLEFIVNVTGRYQYQIDHMREGLDIAYAYIVFMAIVLFLIGYLYKRADRSLQCDFYFYIVFIGVILYELSAISPQLFRVSLYFTQYLIVLIPQVLIKTRNRTLLKITIVSLTIVFSGYAYYYYVIFQMHRIFPYCSEVLGI